jgi:hypothetical protein
MAAQGANGICRRCSRQLCRAELKRWSGRRPDARRPDAGEIGPAFRNTRIQERLGGPHESQHRLDTLKAMSHPDRLNGTIVRNVLSTSEFSIRTRRSRHAQMRSSGGMRRAPLLRLGVAVDGDTNRAAVSLDVHQAATERRANRQTSARTDRGQAYVEGATGVHRGVDGRSAVIDISLPRLNRRGDATP